MVWHEAQLQNEELYAAGQFNVTLSSNEYECTTPNFLFLGKSRVRPVAKWWQKFVDGIVGGVQL